MQKSWCAVEIIVRLHLIFFASVHSTSAGSSTRSSVSYNFCSHRSEKQSTLPHCTLCGRRTKNCIRTHALPFAGEFLWGVWNLIICFSYYVCLVLSFVGKMEKNMNIFSPSKTQTKIRYPYRKPTFHCCVFNLKLNMHLYIKCGFIIVERLRKKILTINNNTFLENVILQQLINCAAQFIHQYYCNATASK